MLANAAASQMVGLIDSVVEEAASFLSATSATLFILDRESGMLWARRRGLPGTPNADAVQARLLPYRLFLLFTVDTGIFLMRPLLCRALLDWNVLAACTVRARGQSFQ